jgi:hypothetical protein
MTDQTTPDAGDAVPAQATKTKTKRDIFRFTGDKPTAINLEHVTQIGLDGNRITFQFYNTALFIDLEDEDSALSVFEVILGVWVGETK